MTLLTLLILSITSNFFVKAIYVPSAGVIGSIDIQSLFNQDLSEAGNVTRNSFENITELANNYGCNIEEHRVTTEDGYILGLHRLTKANGSDNRVPVFLMHGLLDSSDSWILQGPDALGYLLIDEGFDVWMGNARGNKYSSAHTELTPNQNGFWKFSWEEIGTRDLPAMVDYVLTMTGTESLYYVGHSQGTTSFFVMNSLKPEYGNKIKMMFALSPVAWLSHAQSPMLKYLSTVPATVLHYFQYLNSQTFSNNFLHQIYGTMCKVVSSGCGNIFEMLFGTNYFVNKTMLPVIVEHASSSSVLQFVHFWQLYQSGRFCRFDYGWMTNLFVYGQFSAPDYELSGVSVPIVLFFSSNDWLSHPSDVSILRGQLPNVSVSYYSQYFSHVDYLYATVAKEVIYEKIIKHIRDYERR